MKRKKEYTGRCYWENSKNGVCLLAKKNQSCYVIPDSSGIYGRNTGGIVKILLDLFRLCFIQSMRTFAAVKLVPPFE